MEGKGNGRHIHDIFPIRSDAHTQLGSSHESLLWHVEEAFHPSRPDWLVLLCLKEDPHAVTRIARARDFVLPPQVIADLRSLSFEVLVDETYGPRGVGRSSRIPILAGPIDQMTITVDPAYTRFRGEESHAVVQRICRAADECAHSVALQPGDALVFSNWRTVHGRTSFQPRFDGTDRWLKRAFVMEQPVESVVNEGGYIPFNVIDLSGKTGSR